MGMLNSPSLLPATRRRLLDAARFAANAVQDPFDQDGRIFVALNDPFYFLEMNTRLQEDYPMTESITGIDLVLLQIDLAKRASPDKITKFQIPERKGIRLDTGVQEENIVSPFYDPLIAKLIVSGCNCPEV